MVLKMICILFILLCVVVFLVGMVLFLPIKYQFEVQKREDEKEFYLSGRVVWLFRLCSCRFAYEEGNWTVHYRPRFWRNFKRKKNSEVTKETKEFHHTKQKEQVEGEEHLKRKTKDTEIEYTLKKIYVRIKKICLFLTNDVHVKAFQKTKEILVQNISKWKPHTWRGFLRYGMEDPYDTGRILAILSMFYPIYGENLSIYPEFEKTVMEAEIICKGSLSVFQIGILAFHFLRDEDIRKTVKDFRRYQHDNKQI